MKNKIIIGIAGNIGVGKTTMTEILSEKFNINPVYESVIDNPYLKDFYEDMSRWSFNLQVYFLYHRFKSQIDLFDSKIHFIQDRTIYEDKEIFAQNLFELGVMDERDWITYQELYKNMIKFIRQPDLIIYLRASTDVLMSRIKGRKRNFESDISSEYVYRLNLYYDKWISSLDNNKILTINTDQFNIFKDLDSFNNILDKVKKKVCIDE